MWYHRMVKYVCDGTLCDNEENSILDVCDGERLCKYETECQYV